MARIFITGSTDGLGRSAARTLIGEGHDVVLHARSRERADSDGRPVGVEMTAPQAVSLERFNELLASLGQPPLADHEFSR